MKVVIIEDEPLARQELGRLIHTLDNGIEIVAELSSVAESITWFETDRMMDLVFMDIQLSDGMSFEIFERVDPFVPVIFTTAFDEYAIQAFKVNSIDYLLKPIDTRELAAALEKYKHLQHHDRSRLHQVSRLYDAVGGSYKTRFVSKIGDNFKSIPVESIAYFYAEHKSVSLVTQEGKEYLIDYTLDHLKWLIDPALFFRLNRQYIVRIDAITKVSKFFHGRLEVQFQHQNRDNVLVSRNRASDFKQWLDY
jgi:DNA-binding LytR/AlgR family response regulator